MLSMRRWLRSLLIGTAIGVLGAALAVTPVGTEFEKDFGLPWLFKIRGAVEPPEDVVVVGINGSTGRALGLPKLPRDWPRTVHAQLIERLVEYNASVIVFDFDFSRSKSGHEDLVFAQAIADANRVVLFERFIGKKQPISRSDGSNSGWVWVEEGLPPAKPLALAARALGPFPLPKLEATVSQFWTFKSSAGEAPTIAAIALQLHALDIHAQWLETLMEAAVPKLEELPSRAAQIQRPADVRNLMGSLRAAFNGDPDLKNRVKESNALTDDYEESLDPRRRILALNALYAGPSDRYLNFYGPPCTIKTIPYHALVGPDYKGRKPTLEDFSNKVVFVGYSDLFEPEQPDHFYTVFTGADGVDLSGVEILATAFANLLTDRALRPSEALVAAAIVLAFGFVIGASVYFLPALVAVPLAIAMSGLYGVGVQWAFNEAVLWLPLATPVLLQLPLALLVGLMAQYLLERQKEQRISRAISYYLPENIIRDLTEKQVDPESVNKVVYGTCLATDMSGFTTIAEHKTPEELASFMNTYFDALAQPLKRHAVDMTEFHADAIMCAWIEPEPGLTARQNAIFAAIEVVEAIERFSEQDGSIQLSARIGLQDGYFYLGHTGGGGRLAYSILGDPANTAARLESLNKHLKTRLLAAQSVVRDVEGVMLRPLGSFQLVGKAEATPIIEILGTKNGVNADKVDLCEQFAHAFEAFSEHQWSKAEELFGSIIERYPGDGPSSLYLTTCRRYVKDGIPDGDPIVIRMVTK